MRGGVVPFRGTGADARRYVEADRSRADDYYLSDATAIQFSALNSAGEAISARSLSACEYSGWVDWINPDTGMVMGRPRLAGPDRLGSPRFMEMTINAPKSLSIAAALHPEISKALDAAQRDALLEIQRWLGQNSVTRIGPRGRQEVVPVEELQVVGITHRTSRAGDPHRHIHMQIGTRVFAGGKWRGLDTAALFKQQGAIRALGAAIIAANPALSDTLVEHGLTLDPVTGEVVELEPFNALMSKRGEQVRRNLDKLEAEWHENHPGESIGPVVSARLTAKAWALNRPAKKPTNLREEAAWLSELKEAGYDPDALRQRAVAAPKSLLDLSVQQIASRALDRLAATESAWTRHTLQEHATRIITEAGVRATPAELRNLVDLATGLALEDCFSILPPNAAKPDHVAHLTSLRVVEAEMQLRDLLSAATPDSEPEYPNLSEVTAGLSVELVAGQREAAAAIASTDPLVVVEGAAGSGKTSMLAAALQASQLEGRSVRVVAPTKRAAQVAQDELGVSADSVASLVHAHGWRWNSDGVWTRLQPGQADPETGTTYQGPSKAAQLRKGERIVVDEAGMLDQDTALALLKIAAESGATIALVGDRAQLSAVGRGGVLEMAAEARGRVFDMAEVHRFTNPEYADLTIQMRDRTNPAVIFDQLNRLSLIQLHTNQEQLSETVTSTLSDGEVLTVASNEEAARLNETIRANLVESGLVDDTATTVGSDGLPIGFGDLIQTRKNRADLGVANRQQWVVQHVESDGSIWVKSASSNRKRERSVHLPADYVTEHAHLTYASTAYGIQGVTAQASHTFLSEQMSGASIYVGMTRGKEDNRLHVVAETLPEAREQFVQAMERDRADRGLTHATKQATEAIRGLVTDGPVGRVGEEIERLTTRAKHARTSAELWGRAATLIREKTTEAGGLTVESLKAQLARSPQQHNLEQLAILAEVFGKDEVARNRQNYLTANPARNAESYKKEADRATKEAELLASLNPDQAIQRIERMRQAEEAKRATRANQLTTPEPRRTDPTQGRSIGL